MTGIGRERRRRTRRRLSLVTPRTIGREVVTALRPDPTNGDGHCMAGSIHRERPVILGVIGRRPSRASRRCGRAIRT